MFELPVNSLGFVFLTLVNITGIALFFWVYLANRKAGLNRLFSIVVVCMVVWIDFNYAGDVVTQPQLALLFKRIYLALVSIFFVLAYYFAILFPVPVRRRHFLLERIGVFALVLISFLTISTNFVIKNHKKIINEIEKIIQNL